MCLKSQKFIHLLEMLKFYSKFDLEAHGTVVREKSSLWSLRQKKCIQLSRKMAFEWLNVGH